MYNKEEALNAETFSAEENNDKDPKRVEDKLAVAPTANIATIGGRGLEDISRADIIIPRIKLLQAMSNEVSDGTGNAGEYYNTLGHSYGAQLNFAVVSRWRSRTLFADDLNEAPICQSLDGFISIDGKRCKVECPHNAAHWDNDNRIPPKCAEAINFLVLPEDETFPAICSFMRSSYRAGRELNTLLMAARCDVWCWKYQLFATKKIGNKGTYFKAGVRKLIEDGKPVQTEDSVRELAEQFYYMMKQGRINFEEEVDAEYNGEPPPF